MTDERALIVVDAANVVGSRPNGWWRDRVGAARRLLTQLNTWEQRTHGQADVVVVLEGAANAAVGDREGPDVGDVRVVRAEGSGDDSIVDVVASAVDEDGDRPITVVTADRGLRDRVAALGAHTVGPRWLLDRIES
ncbi:MULTISPECIES: NYN domain-containing protein [unclassified Rhodococcus (in: high G+C Gram-positive bacteria)]|uniref:NYN domain-containing protein n=1 Tax=unclassified Rhodococcus (in: high G+C Gram-positive bacteria) TaxID=192944 RepID=UPI002897A64E|nr:MULTISPECIES: NYN domain-containing protein [unclassified Rhodococcus (in: high G+C Gram-positive bacteria)]